MEELVPKEEGKEIMKIVPNSFQKVSIALALLMELVVLWESVSLYIELHEVDVLFLFMTIAMSFMLFSCIFMSGRSYCYTRNGCIVSFLFYKKIYLWSDLRVKRYEKNFKISFNRTYEIADGAFFSVRPYRRFRIISPATYLDTFRLFSSFYIIFPHMTLKDKTIRYSKYPYPVADRDEFLGLLKEWGVEIEGLD